MLRRAVLILVGIGIVLVILVLFHRPLLSTAASLWIVDSSDFERVDLILIPGGSFDTRPFGAADLFLSGRADLLSVFKTEKMPTVEMGLRPDDNEICIAVLDRLKVPLESILTLGDGEKSVLDEVVATRAWCLEHQPRAIAKPPPTPDLRRVGSRGDEKGNSYQLFDVGLVVNLWPCSSACSDRCWLAARSLRFH